MGFDKKDIINRMTEIREELTKIIDNKYELVDKLNEEIEILSQRVNNIDEFISDNTKFNTAYKLLNEKELSEEDVDRINIVDQRIRKLFSQEDPEAR